ncbi:TonB-linked SusC/RagA family outer membrane protein [Chitinophaga polysaccharea]|uniref:TonB-linked SusC/RagA family outer membrane protein n=1 Tax=Chitinophaga polysaccharea TaxID=1293035 RepID=A0A561PXT3_9BACT|nr:SusC/RagA family TonB-linked outer membrane protein [Chitinophaga polysaccharea]TWF42932.1 TonB-linked SusC/RagA family outer membrane protein [Chitinophaga polysaccharea]
MQSTVRRSRRSGKLLLIFIAFILFVDVRGWAQKVSISAQHASIDAILKDVRRQTGYNFFCKAEWARKIGPVTLEVKDVPVAEVLERCLQGHPFSYSILNQTIAIYPMATLGAGSSPAGTYIVTGTVTDTRNKPLEGASVVVQRSHQGTITDAKGHFTLKNIRPSDTLKVSFIGYNARQVPITGQTDISIVLKDASSLLDEVVTQAYSKSSPRLMTGNITKITAAEIEKQPVMNPLAALEGRVPGMVISYTNGFASSPVSVQIRGINSLNAGVPADPLYVIDGVPLNVLSLGNSYNHISSGFIQSVNYNYPSGTTTNGQSPLFSINPEDIESIDVLKDADATAVYGANGSNGVILITTKRGKPGKTRFDLNVDPPMLSWGRTTRLFKYANTQDYLQMRREALKNSGITPNLQNAADLLLWDTTRYTDWGKQVLGSRAVDLNVTAGISGGSEQTSFRINANYNRLTNTTSISGATQRMTFASNINHTTSDQKLSVNLSANFAYSYVNVVPPVIDPGWAPNAPPVFDKKGNPNWAEWDANGLLSIYPFGAYLNPSNPQATTTLTSSLRLDYKPFRGVTFTTLLGYNFAYNSTNAFITIASQGPYVSSPIGSANFSITQNAGWTINPQVSYNTRLGKGHLQVSFIGNEIATATRGSNQYGFGYDNDILLGSIANAPSILTSAAYSQAKTAAFIGDVSYNWDDRYILHVNGTKQGSSKFGPQAQYGSFGSIGLAWIASGEKWLREKLPTAISFLKFRGSYGLTGDDGGLDYQYLALWQVQTYSSYAGGGYNGQSALTPSIRPNQRYKWQENRKLETALQLGLFKDKVSLDISWYRNRVSDQISAYPTPGFINSVNINSLTTNVPLVIQNSGWEGNLSAQLIAKKDFSLSARFNIGINRNILLSFPNLENTPYAGLYRVGQSINTQYVFHFIGVDPLTGKAAFQDYNHDGIINGAGGVAPAIGLDDRGLAYDLQPKFDGGFGMDASYKRFRFSVFFRFKKQTGMNMLQNIAYSPGTFNQNVPEFIARSSHWQKPGDVVPYPAFNTQPVDNSWSQLRWSNLTFTDASYIRLNNASIYYTLPPAWSKKAGMKELTLSLHAQNVLTLTHYAGGDPETPGNVMPLAGLYTAKINWHF